MVARRHSKDSWFSGLERPVKVLLLLAVLSLAFFFSIILISSFYEGFVLDYSVIPVVVEVGDHVGFNLDEGVLNFGTLLGSGRAERSMAVSFDGTGFVFVSAEPPFSDWLTVEAPDGFFVEEGSPVRIDFRLSVPGGVEQGFYESEVNIYILEGQPGFFHKLFLKGSEVEVGTGIARPSSPQVLINVTGN